MSNNPPKTARLAPVAQGQKTEELAHVSSFALIKRGDNNELLLEKKLRPEFSAGKWVLPSAIINFGEPPDAAIKRIVREQLGAEPGGVRLLDVQSWGDKHWDICFVYSVSVGDLGKLSSDIERVEYFPREKLPLEFRSDNMEVLESYESRLMRD